jgi:hypothetical protein
MKICGDKTLSLKIHISHCVPYSFPPFYTRYLIFFPLPVQSKPYAYFLNFFAPSDFGYSLFFQCFYILLPVNSNPGSSFSTLGTRIAEPENFEDGPGSVIFSDDCSDSVSGSLKKSGLMAIKREINCQTANHIEKKNPSGCQSEKETVTVRATERASCLQR